VQNQITEMIHHMANSQEQMANIIEAKRHVAIHISLLNQQISQADPNMGEIESLMEHSLLVTKSITSYLNSLADLEDALSENLSCIMKEMSDQPGDE
jgi:methyl-accepting chemotaxis protein